MAALHSAYRHLATLGDCQLMTEVSIVIPVCNEQENLPILLDRLETFEQQTRLCCAVIIVDDGSTDGTSELADSYANEQQRCCVLHNRGQRKGMGYALKLGTRSATTPFVIWLMGDLSDDLSTVPDICGKLEDGYDLVIASRYMAGGSTGDLDPVKSFLSGLYSQCMRIAFGLPVHDINNAFRGFRKCVFDAVNPRSDDFAISPEFAIRAHLLGYRLGEVPTTYHNRTQGQNKFRMIPMILRYSTLLRYRFKALR